MGHPAFHNSKFLASHPATRKCGALRGPRSLGMTNALIRAAIGFRKRKGRSVLSAQWWRRMKLPQRKTSWDVVFIPAGVRIQRYRGTESGLTRDEVVEAPTSA